MFHSIFITTEHGICIFEKHFIKTKMDGQLITGFINALGSFATEALGSEMQSLRLQTGEQLFVLPYRETSIIGIAITGAKDHPKLVQKLLNQMLADFSMIFQRNLEVASNVQQFEEFKYNIDIILNRKVASRTKLKMILGVVAAWVLIGVIALALSPLYIKASFETNPDLGVIDFTDGLEIGEIQTLELISIFVVIFLMVFSCVMYLLPAFLAAYVAGNRRRGIYSALLLGASVFVFFILGNLFNQELQIINPVAWFLAFSPLLISLSILCGIYGGTLKERRKLYPLAS